MKVLLSVFGLVLMLQFGCASKTETSSAAMPTELQKAKTESQKLIADGIKFDFAGNADGMTGEGGTYTGHSYESSDKINIGTRVGIYKSEENAAKRFEDELKQPINIIVRDIGNDGGNVERAVAVSNEADSSGKSYFVIKKKENRCAVYFSRSLKHLLAFEKWRDKN